MRNARELLRYNVKRLRDALGLDQIKLADRVHLSFQMIQKIEQCKTGASLGTLDKLARGLGVNHADLLFDETAAPSPAKTISQLTVDDLMFAIKGSSNQGSELEAARLKKENEELKAKIASVHPEFWDAWPKAKLRQRAFALFFVTLNRQHLAKVKGEFVDEILRVLNYHHLLPLLRKPSREK